MDLERAVYLGLSSFLIGGEILLVMICYYFSFLIEGLWLDRQDNILLGVILFFVLAKRNLICRIWTF